MPVNHANRGLLMLVDSNTDIHNNIRRIATHGDDAIHDATHGASHDDAHDATHDDGAHN